MERKEYTLRPYQQECVDILDKVESGNVLVALATGMGKSMIFTNIKRNGRVLILSHRDELVRQPEKYYAEDVTFGIEKGDEYSHGEDVVSASVQTLYKENRLKRFSPDDFDTIICDEAHHMCSNNKSYMNIIKYFTGARRLLGFTATPKRGDKVRLDDVFDEIVFARDIKWGIQNNYLSPVRCMLVSGQYSLKNVKKDSFGDFSKKDLDDLFIKYKEIIPTAARAYVDNCLDRHTLLYCVNKRICYQLLNTIKRMLPVEKRNSIEVLTGDNTPEERADILDRFSKGELKAIINCMILTEGTDLPITDCILNLRLTCNRSLFQQMAGRGLRLYDGKEYCLLIDIVPEDVEYTRSLCTAPDLFGIDPSTLTKKQRERFNKNNDMLELCEDYSSEFTSVARAIQIQTQEVNLLVEEYNELISGNNTLKALSETLKHNQEEKKGGYEDLDFGDLAYTVTPYDKRKFRIQATYDTSIYLSEPDVLNNSTVTIESNYGIEGVKKMKFDEAIDFITGYCQMQPDYYAYCWSKQYRNYIDHQSPTVAQFNRLGRDYTVERGSEADSISKLDASALIDFKKQYSESVQKKKELDLISSNKKTRQAELLREDFNRKFDKAVQGQKDSETAFDAIYEKVRKFQKKEKKFSIATEYPVKATGYIPSKGMSPTQKQIGFYSSLKDRIDNQVVELGIDEELEKNLSMRQMSIMLPFLMDLRDKMNPIKMKTAGKKLVFTNVNEILKLADEDLEEGNLYVFKAELIDVRA